MVSEGADNYAIEQTGFAKIFFCAYPCRYVLSPAVYYFIFLELLASFAKLDESFRPVYNL